MFVLKSERFWFFSLSCLYGPSSCQLPPIFLRKNLARLMHFFLFLISLKNRFSVQNLFDTISITVIPWLTWSHITGLPGIWCSVFTASPDVSDFFYRKLVKNAKLAIFGDIQVQIWQHCENLSAIFSLAEIWHFWDQN